MLAKGDSMETVVKRTCKNVISIITRVVISIGKEG